MDENTEINVSSQEIKKLFDKLTKNAKTSGYYLNPDKEFTNALLEALLINEKRYGYQGCPCRLSAENRLEDLDIICPCDYRDADVDEFGSCYCALYVSSDIAEGKKEPQPIPERRPIRKERMQFKSNAAFQHKTDTSGLSKPVWRCRVCGYLCARDAPPTVCPICKAGKDRFERFM